MSDTTEPGKRPPGRPRLLGPRELETLRLMVAAGVSVTHAARALNISRSAAYKSLARERSAVDTDGAR